MYIKVYLYLFCLYGKLFKIRQCFAKNSYDFRVELFVCKLLEFSKGLFRRYSRTIRPRRCHGVISVGNSKDSGYWRDILTGKAIWISIAVIMLVMLQDGFAGSLQVGNVLEYF